MSDPIKEFEELSHLAEQHRMKKNKISGAMEQIAKTLKAKGLKSTNEARLFIQKKTAEKNKKKTELSSRINAFRKKYGKHLRNSNSD